MRRSYESGKQVMSRNQVRGSAWQQPSKIEAGLRGKSVLQDHQKCTPWLGATISNKGNDVTMISLLPPRGSKVMLGEGKAASPHPSSIWLFATSLLQKKFIATLPHIHRQPAYSQQVGLPHLIPGLWQQMLPLISWGWCFLVIFWVQKEKPEDQFAVIMPLGEKSCLAFKQFFLKMRMKFRTLFCWFFPFLFSLNL